MKKVFFSIGFLAAVFSGNCYAFDDGDSQYWNTQSISVTLNDDWKLGLEEEFRFGDDSGKFYYQHSDIGLSYHGIADWLSIGVNYRHVFEEKDIEWVEENRPHLNATLKWKLFNYGFSNRSRFEYRNCQAREESWRYRNKFSIRFPLKITQLNIQPYIADEIFYDFDTGMLGRNRLYAGLAFKLSENTNAEVYYLWQADEKEDKWSDTHVLGTKLKVNF